MASRERVHQLSCQKHQDGATCTCGAEGQEQAAREAFDARHPGCCPRCGWHLSSHGHSHGYQSDCPWGDSPASRDGTLATLYASTRPGQTSTPPTCGIRGCDRTPMKDRTLCGLHAGALG